LKSISTIYGTAAVRRPAATPSIAVMPAESRRQTPRFRFPRRCGTLKAVAEKLLGISPKSLATTPKAILYGVKVLNIKIIYILKYNNKYQQNITKDGNTFTHYFFLCCSLFCLLTAQMVL